MTKEIYENFCNGIVEQAAKDYRKLLHAKPTHYNIYELKKIEQFFRSEYLKKFTEVDGEWLIRKLREVEGIDGLDWE